MAWTDHHTCAESTRFPAVDSLDTDRLACTGQRNGRCLSLPLAIPIGESLSKRTVDQRVAQENFVK